MTNRSALSRKEQVLERLRRAGGAWVDGSELATPEVGGSEGLRRLRELRAEGHAILDRQHPDPERDIRQYRLVVGDQPAPPVELPPGYVQASLFGDPPPEPPRAWQDAPSRGPATPGRHR